MSDDDDPTAITRYDWERIVRRVRMNPSAKLVALAMATYASRDGSSMYPGIAKLAAVTGLTEKTVRAALKTLRELGLLERTREGFRNGRRALADEHRMRRPADLFERVHTLDLHESPESIECDETCRHAGTPVMSSGDKPADAPGISTEHRNSVPGTPVMSSGTPELSSPNTGNEFPPPAHDHPRNQPKNQREDQLGNVSTEGQSVDLDELKAKLIQFDELAARRRGA